MLCYNAQHSTYITNKITTQEEGGGKKDEEKMAEVTHNNNINDYIIILYSTVRSDDITNNMRDDDDARCHQFIHLKLLVRWFLGCSQLQRSTSYAPTLARTSNMRIKRAICMCFP